MPITIDDLPYETYLPSGKVRWGLDTRMDDIGNVTITAIHIADKRGVRHTISLAGEMINLNQEERELISTIHLDGEDVYVTRA